MKFEILVATLDRISDVKKYARLLGPIGMMPNKKSGTQIESKQIMDTIKNMKRGMIEFRQDQRCNINLSIGKKAFSEDQLVENLEAIARALADKKPETHKGKKFSGKGRANGACR